MKKINLTKDQYNSVDLRSQLQPMEYAEFTLNTTNKCFAREIPAGKSKSGKEYSAFKVYSISAEVDGVEEPTYIKIPNANAAMRIETFSVGDTVVVTCIPHPKGKSFLVEKKEE